MYGILLPSGWSNQEKLRRSATITTKEPTTSDLGRNSKTINWMVLAYADNRLAAQNFITNG